VAELVDAPDSKSGGRKVVLVRSRPGAPQQNQTLNLDFDRTAATYLDGFGTPSLRHLRNGPDRCRWIEAQRLTKMD
jgi:hypothetical protein